jgi:hypothetical protein
MAFSNWIYLKAQQSAPSTFNGLSLRVLPQSSSSSVLSHPDTPLTPARYVGYKPSDESIDHTTPNNISEHPHVSFEMAPSTITPRCYTFNNKR